MPTYINTGEASCTTVLATFISDNFPPDERSSRVRRFYTNSSCLVLNQVKLLTFIRVYSLSSFNNFTTLLQNTGIAFYRVTYERLANEMETYLRGSETLQTAYLDVITGQWLGGENASVILNSDRLVRMLETYSRSESNYYGIFTSPSIWRNPETLTIDSPEPTRPSGEAYGQFNSRVGSGLAGYTVSRDVGPAVSASASGRERLSAGDALRLRSEEDARNDQAHNLNLLYSGCYGRMGREVIYIHTFDGNPVPRARVHKLTEDSIADTGKNMPFDSSFDMSIPPLGWISPATGAYAAFIRLSPGTYFRGASRKNLLVKRILHNTGESSTDGNFNTELAKLLFNKTYFSMDEAAARGRGAFAINEYAALWAPSPDQGAAKHVFFNDTKVGVLNEKFKFVKVLKKYSGLLPRLQKLVNYECR